MKETALILAAQKGDKAAFQALIEFYYPFVSRFLRKMAPDDASCEDLTQETFLRLIRAIDRYDVHGKAAFSTYVLTIARRACIDSWRKNKQPMDDIAVHENLTAGASVELLVEQSLDAETAVELLDSLPPEQAAAIRMKYLERQSLEEIARQLGCQPKTIKSRIHNGIVKLRRAMNRGGHGHG